jgi:hypothetical protein
MSNELAVRSPSIIRSMDDAERAAIAMSKSGFFTDAQDAGKAIVKILAGQEMGFGPFASMTGIFIIQGRPSIGANLMASAVKGSGRYDYRVAELSDTVCELAFFEAGKEIGRSRFTIEDARKAQTKNVDKFPRNMLFARAISNGVRWFCPDVFNGSAVYTPEELGANTDGEGNVIDLPVKKVDQATGEIQPPSQFEPAPASKEHDHEIDIKRDIASLWPSDAKVSWQLAATVLDSKGGRYVDYPKARVPHVRSALQKRLAENHLTPEEVEAVQLKLAVLAIVEVL